MLYYCGVCNYTRPINSKKERMYTQKEIEELVGSYLSGNATDDDIEKLTLWIEESSENHTYYHQLCNIWQMANLKFSPDEINVDEAHRRFIRHIEQRKWSPSGFFVYWQRIAAILLLPLVLVFSYLMLDKPANYSEAIYQEIFAPYGTHSKINLPDGSLVWLNAGSSLKYPAVFLPGERKIHLTGEAYFEVESDVENPFIVETEHLQVRATGTAFNVEAYSVDSIVSVTMVKGEVNVLTESSSTLEMMPGERFRYNLYTMKGDIEKTDPYKWYAWIDGRMVFRDDPLEYVFKRIGQTFNIDVSVKDTSIAKHLYRATFEEESLDEILRLLQMTAPIQYTYLEREKNGQNQYERQKIEVFEAKK